MSAVAPMDVDPDESCWVESVKFNVSFLVVIRVFFEFGFSACEEIGRFAVCFQPVSPALLLDAGCLLQISYRIACSVCVCVCVSVCVVHGRKHC